MPVRTDRDGVALQIQLPVADFLVYRARQASGSVLNQLSRCVLVDSF
jgi:hypothetical protein